MARQNESHFCHTLRGTFETLGLMEGWRAHEEPSIFLRIPPLLTVVWRFHHPNRLDPRANREPQQFYPLPVSHRTGNSFLLSNSGEYPYARQTIECRRSSSIASARFPGEIEIERARLTRQKVYLLPMWENSYKSMKRFSLIILLLFHFHHITSLDSAQNKPVSESYSGMK